MAASVTPKLSQFAADVLEGLSNQQKRISPRYFYDDLGSALFEAITLLPEYGLTRADRRLLQTHSNELALAADGVNIVAELGSGTGKKTSHILAALSRNGENPVYCPIDVSQAALDACEKELGNLARVRPICADWLDGLAQLAGSRLGNGRLLVLFLGSSIGNLERSSLPNFFRDIRALLQHGDLFLLGADLLKPVLTMLAAYDDPTGVTAAFNLNVLARMNRELDAAFHIRSFHHQAGWNSTERRIEMHLSSGSDQEVYIGALDSWFRFRKGETIWTESSHKFTKDELETYARSTGFTPVANWIDAEWPFAECLWRVDSAAADGIEWN